MMDERQLQIEMQQVLASIDADPSLSLEEKQKERYRVMIEYENVAEELHAENYDAFGDLNQR